MKTTWIHKQEVCQMLGICERTLSRYRKKYWYRGIHFSRLPGSCVYNKELIEDWIANRHDSTAHLRAIEMYQASLPSNQKRKRA